MRYPICMPPRTRFEALPADALDDPFGPPAEAVEVRCLHCDNVYSSDRMVWYRGLWCCPHIACGGAGFGFDLFPADDRMWHASAAEIPDGGEWEADGPCEWDPLDEWELEDLLRRGADGPAH